jgi:hypothetical protein
VAGEEMRTTGMQPRSRQIGSTAWFPEAITESAVQANFTLSWP